MKESQLKSSQGTETSPFLILNPMAAAENPWGFPAFLQAVSDLGFESGFQNTAALKGAVVFGGEKGIEERLAETLRVLADFGASAFVALGRTVRTVLVGGVLMALPLKASAQDWTAGFNAAPTVAASPVPTAASTPVAAQAREENVTTMPEMTVIGSSYKADILASPKYTAPLLDTPKTINILPSQLLQDQGSTSLREALQNVPGITMNAGENNTPAGDSFNIRGFSAKNDMYHDGFRDLSSYSRDTFAVERVEVTQGPSSSFAGRGSTGGTINVISKTPQADPFVTTAAALGTANGTLLGGTKRGTVDINQPLNVPGLEKAAFRLTALQQNSGVAGRQYLENKSTGLAPSFSFGLGRDTKFVLEYYGLHQDNTPDYGVPAMAGSSQNPPADVDPSNYYGLIYRDREKVDVNSILLKWDQELNPSLHLHDQISYNRSFVDRIVTVLETVSDTARKPKTHINLEESFDNQLDLSFKFDTGGIQHTAVVGTEYVHEYSYFGKYAGFTDPGVGDVQHPDPYSPYTGPITVSNAVNRVANDTVGFYAMDTLKFSEQWQATGGTRFDTFAPMNLQQGVSVVPPPIASQQMLSWNGGIIYKPVAAGSFYVSVTDSLNPSIQGLSLDSSQSANIGQLAPEESISYEAGTKWELIYDRLTVTGAAFRTDKVNARMPDPDSPQSTVQILGGKQRVDGGTIAIQGSPIERLDMTGAYTYMKGTVLSGLTRATSVVAGPVTNVAFVPQDGWALVNVPTHSASFWTTYTTPFGLQLGGGAVYESERPIQTGPTAPVTTAIGTVIAPATMLKDYVVFNAMLGLALNKNLNVQLNLFNLADSVYFTQGRFWIEGTRRSGVLTTTLKF